MLYVYIERERERERESESERGGVLDVLNRPQPAIQDWPLEAQSECSLSHLPLFGPLKLS